MQMTGHGVKITQHFTLLALLILIAVLLPWNVLRGRWRLNFAAMRVVQSQDGEAGDLSTATGALEALEKQDCRAFWVAGMGSQMLADQAKRDQLWERALACDPAYVSILRDLAIHQPRLVEAAVGLYPHTPDAWFWLAEITSPVDPIKAARDYSVGLRLDPKNVRAWRALGNILAALEAEQAAALFDELGLDALVNKDIPGSMDALFIQAQILADVDPDQAIALYRRGLALAPSDGVRWRELGDLLVEDDPGAAIEAYLQSCNNGDPGKHGCYGAGLVAEKIGDYQSALKYYRLSTWSGAQLRAQMLQGMIKDASP